MKMRWLLLCVAVCMLGCSGDAVPVGPTEAVAPEVVAEFSGTVHASNGQSGCYAVKFNVSGNVLPGGFPVSPWVVSGDLVGEQTWFPDVTSFRLAGVTFNVSGEMAWNIDGGVVPGLGEFKTSFDLKNLNIDRPGSPANIAENIGTHRALEGVQKANLTLKGVTEAAEDSSSMGSSSMDYQGVICP
jgi:hypothetical protein